MIDCYRMRYVVPFELKGEINFEQLCEKVSENENWECDDVRNGEQDIYQYILDSFVSKENRSNIGCAWTYVNPQKREIVKLAYQPEEEQEMIPFQICDAGLFLFRTGIGLFWYEIKFKKQVSIAQLITFQNAFKELNRNGNFEKFFRVQEDGENIPFPEEKLHTSEQITSEEIENYNRCLFKEGERFILCSDLPKSPEEAVKVEYRFLPKEKELHRTFYHYFMVGDWTAQILAETVGEVAHFPSKPNCIKNSQIAAPDKALLFNYMVLKEEPEEYTLTQTAYYLTNGYTTGYEMLSNMGENMYRPFENAYWYVSKSGCGYYVKSNKENADFFKKTMKQKVMDDYFVLYICALHQSYTLLHFAEMIEESLSADVKTYREGNAFYVNLLEDLTTSINVFLTKSVYASISHIQHQNAFYEYAVKRLRIQEDVISITAGLDSLEELQRMHQKEQEETEKVREEKSLNTGLGLLALFAVFSALVDGRVCVEYLWNLIGNDLPAWGEQVLYGVFCAGVLLIALFVVYRLVKFSRMKQSKKKRKKK